jgi:hypothetical protein
MILREATLPLTVCPGYMKLNLSRRPFERRGASDWLEIGLT